MPHCVTFSRIIIYILFLYGTWILAHFLSKLYKMNSTELGQIWKITPKMQNALPYCIESPNQNVVSKMCNMWHCWNPISLKWVKSHTFCILAWGLRPQFKRSTLNKKFNPLEGTLSAHLRLSIYIHTPIGTTTCIYFVQNRTIALFYNYKIYSILYNRNKW